MIEFIEDFHKTAITHNISPYDLKFIIKLFLSIQDENHNYAYSDEFKELSYNIIEAFREEFNKYYENSADNYIKAFEEIKDKIPYSKKNETKKFFELKISKMKYNHALFYYKEKDYSYAADLFRECLDLDNKYITNDIKSDCQYQLIFSLYF